jgi:cytochrome c-type biogenesis protein CcmF
MAQFGSFSIILALLFSFYAFTVGVMTLYLGPRGDRLAETARRAGIASAYAVVAAAVALVISVLNNDFSLVYIKEHSNIALPVAYKVAALWSGQEGSLLFWVLLLSVYGMVVRMQHRTDVKLFAYASTILAGCQLFFLLLINFAAHPFALTPGEVPADGNGLNPLLQYPEMVIHPPMLYLGYVGMSVPFAFALGALIMKYPGEKWIHITRRWTMIAWLFLTIGIFLGGHWAYSVLGWGGYWAWDPVENASLLPWLTATAFLHSVMMQEKRGMMKVWNIWLIFITFLLCIFGTFLTRSGIVSSVHAFAQSAIGDWFVAFMIVVGAACIFFFILNRDHLKSENKLEALVSRESSFLFNNLLLLVSCFAVLWGTIFPILSEWVQGHKVTVGPPFFNKVNIPIGLGLLFLTAVGPLLAWRKTSFASLKRNFMWPTILAVLTAIALFIGGIHPWDDGDPAAWYAVIAIALSVLVAGTIVSEFWRGARVIRSHTGMNMLASVVHLTRRNTRRYGGYVVHMGVVIMCVGFAGAAFNQTNERELGFKESMTIGPYTLVNQQYTHEDNENYTSELAIVDVYKHGNFVTTLYPSKRMYKSSGQPSTIVALRSTLKEDVYLVYAGRNDDSGKPIIKAHLNPLVMWIWIGLIVIIWGTLIALVPNLPAAAAAKPVATSTPAVAERTPESVGADD